MSDINFCEKHNHPMQYINKDMHGGDFYICSSCALEIGQENRRKLMEYPNLKSAHTAAIEQLRRVREVLAYYGSSESYEERVTFTEIRPPGVLTEGGDKAREALADLDKFLSEQEKK